MPGRFRVPTSATLPQVITTLNRALDASDASGLGGSGAGGSGGSVTIGGSAGGTGAIVSFKDSLLAVNGPLSTVLTSLGPSFAPVFSPIPSTVGTGWHDSTLGTNGTFDWTAQTTQTIGSDTTFLIGGASWLMQNSANCAVATQVTNGVGLTFIPASSTQFYATARTAPMLLLPLSSVIPSFNSGTPVEISCYWSAQNPSADYDEAFVGIDSGSGFPMELAWRAGIAHNSLLYQQLVLTFEGGIGVGGVPQGHQGTSDVVEVLTFPSGYGQGQATLESSPTAYSGGAWPAVALRASQTFALTGAFNAFPTPDGISLCVGAQRQGSGTNLVCTLAALRVRYR